MNNFLKKMSEYIKEQREGQNKDYFKDKFNI
jgi:hypothetical protein